MTANELEQVLSNLGTPWWQIILQFITILIPITIAIAGYCHNWKVMKSTLAENARQNQMQIEANNTQLIESLDNQSYITHRAATLELLKDVPLELWNHMEKVRKSEDTGNLLGEYTELLGKIFCYGSNLTVGLAVAFQKHCNQETVDPWKTYALLTLLIVQLKFDLMREPINAQILLDLRLAKDFDSDVILLIIEHIKEYGEQCGLCPELYS